MFSFFSWVTTRSQTEAKTGNLAGFYADKPEFQNIAATGSPDFKDRRAIGFKEMHKNIILCNIYIHITIVGKDFLSIHIEILSDTYRYLDI